MSVHSNYPDGFTQAMHDDRFIPRGKPAPVCDECDAELDEYVSQAIEVQVREGFHNGASCAWSWQTRNFCDPACRFKHVFNATDTFSGRTEILRLLAAIQILVESNLERAPLLGEYGIGGDDAPQIRKLVELARSLSNQIDPDGATEPTLLACAAADTLMTSLEWSQIDLDRRKKSEVAALSERQPEEVK